MISSWNSSGYSTRVGERGSGLLEVSANELLSHVQCSKNRFLYLTKQLVLDYITERQVCLNLKREFEGTTVFFITHRLSTIRGADHILLMDSGSLLEEGSHEHLLDQRGRYFALYSQQESSLD